MFLQVCVILFTGGFCLSAHPLGRYPLGRYTPQAGTPLWTGTPPRQVHPPGRYTPHPTRYTPLSGTPPGRYSRAGTPPWVGTTPLGRYTSPRQVHNPPGSRLRHTVNERPVRILLECILVES